MKKALVNALKILVPLAIGVWLIHKQYSDLSTAQRAELFTAFRAADLGWLALAIVIGWFAHVSRGWRWRYLLDPLGYKPGFWSCYHAVMIGYFVNMFIPRAGEASRAASLYRVEQVPFDKGFGTIMAERVVDMVVLGLLGVLAMLMQLDKLDLFRTRIEQFRSEQTVSAESSGGWGLWIALGVALALLAGVYLLVTRPALRSRVMDLIRGFMEGLRTVFLTRKKGLFILHTLLIWASYLGMFQVGFYCLPSMVDVPFAGILAGFIAGAIGIILVQGGIGVYPAFVALIVGVYMPAPDGGGLLRPDALAMGWLLWAAQMVMIIVLGGLSLLLTALKRTPST
ncbi:MAG: flippase-like domain-containing protein [Flavobacteriales bacterium]|nr:flippase-like domain-containing protein [Flavobacteriales bacterium]